MELYTFDVDGEIMFRLFTLLHNFLEKIAFFQNWQTYVAAWSLSALGFCQMLQGDVIKAVSSFLAALALFGVNNTFRQQNQRLAELKRNQVVQMRHLGLLPPESEETLVEDVHKKKGA